MGVRYENWFGFCKRERESLSACIHRHPVEVTHEGMRGIESTLPILTFLVPKSPNMPQDTGKLKEVPTPGHGEAPTSPPLLSGFAESTAAPDTVLPLQDSLKELPKREAMTGDWCTIPK